MTLPPVRCGLSFDANLDNARPDRRGGVLRLTGDIRRNVAYTTHAEVLRNEATGLNAGNQSVQLMLDSSAGSRSLLLNITPRMGFNRYIPPGRDP